MILSVVFGPDVSARAPAGGWKRLTHPEVVHEGDDALELLTDFHVDVLVEAGPHWAEGGQRWPVVLASCGGEKQKQIHKLNGTIELDSERLRL